MFTYQTPTRHALLAVQKRALNLDVVVAYKSNADESYVGPGFSFYSRKCKFDTVTID